jgi:hypothetical protein
VSTFILKNEPTGEEALVSFIENLVSRIWVANAETRTQAGRNVSTYTNHPGYALVLHFALK